MLRGTWLILQCHLAFYEDAEQHYRDAISMYRDNPETQAGNLANALRAFAVLLEKRNKKPEAIATWKETRELYEKVGLQAGVAEADDRLDALQSTEE